MMRSVPGHPRSNVSAPDVNGTGSPDTSAIDPSLLPSPSAVRTPPAGTAIGSPSTKVAGSVGSRGNAAQQHPPSSSTAQMAAFIAQSQSQSQPQQGQQGPSASFSPGGHLNFGELQGMDFLNQVGTNGNVPGGAEEAANGDFGFGLGWEGLHHDFSDGQQYDLFDGFFFGGQQGGAGSNGVL